MGFEIVVSAQAAIEIEDALDWYQKISPDLAKDLYYKYTLAKEAITINPKHFQKHSGGYRKIVLDRFPYKIVFKVFDSSVLIIAFAHHKQRNYWRKR